MTYITYAVRTIKSRSFRSAVFGISSLSCCLALRLLENKQSVAMCNGNMQYNAKYLKLIYAKKIDGSHQLGISYKECNAQQIYLRVIAIIFLGYRCDRQHI